MAVLINWLVGSVVWTLVALGFNYCFGPNAEVTAGFVKFTFGVGVGAHIFSSLLLLACSDKDPDPKMQKSGAVLQIHRRPLYWGGMLAAGAAITMAGLCSFAMVPPDTALFVVFRMALVAFVAGFTGASVSALLTSDPTGGEESPKVEIDAMPAIKFAHPNLVHSFDAKLGAAADEQDYPEIVSLCRDIRDSILDTNEKRILLEVAYEFLARTSHARKAGSKDNFVAQFIGPFTAT